MSGLQNVSCQGALSAESLILQYLKKLDWFNHGTCKAIYIIGELFFSIILLWLKQPWGRTHSAILNKTALNLGREIGILCWGAQASNAPMLHWVLQVRLGTEKGAKVVQAAVVTLYSLIVGLSLCKVFPLSCTVCFFPSIFYTFGISRNLAFLFSCFTLGLKYAFPPKLAQNSS